MSATRRSHWLTLALAASAWAQCEDWCVEPCAQLNGPYRLECADCAGDAFACRPPFEAEAEAARAPQPAAAVAVDPSGRARAVHVDASADLSANESLPCQRLTHAELQAATQAERARLLARPTLISGALEAWPAMTQWSDAASFGALYGEHGVLAKRFMAAIDGADRRLAGRDPKASLVSVAEVVGRSEWAYGVIYNGEGGNARSEERLLGAIARSGHAPCVDVLGRACGITVLSLGGGLKGVEPANHGFAWIGLVAGAKLWYVSPPTSERFGAPSCADRASIEVLGGEVTHCLQRPGEVMVVPTAWWHATCNLGEFTLGVGGQDYCDLEDCTPVGPAGETAHERHMRMVFCADGARQEACHGAAGLEIAARETRRAASDDKPWVVEEEAWLPS